MHSRFVTSIRDDPRFTLTTIIYVVLDLEYGLANTLHDLWRPCRQRRQYVYTRKRRSRTTDGRTTSKGRCWSFCGTAVNSSASCARMTSSVNNNPPICFEAGLPCPLSSEPCPRGHLGEDISHQPLGPDLRPWSIKPEEAALEAALEAEDADSYTSARVCMDNKEFQRAVHVLQTCKSSKSSFLSSYCQFLVGILTSSNS